MCENTGDSTRILYQNTCSLGLTGSAHSLEEICDFMSTWNVDICCLVETNTHWKHRRTKGKLLNVLNKFGKRQKIQTSETVTTWPSIYKPGGTMMISSPSLASRVITSGEDEEEYGRWSYTTYGGENNKRLTIIAAYRTCIPYDEMGVSTVHSQQWDIMEERNIEHMNIRAKIIKKDINIFMAILIKQNHEVITFIDGNEQFIPGNKGISKLTSHPAMLDPLLYRHNLKYEPHTHKRGSFRIDFVVCTKIINQYITKCGILPFDTVTVSDHRPFYLDVNMFAFLNDKVYLPTPTSRLLSFKAPDVVATYKQNMIIYLTKHNILDRINVINDKLKDNQLFSRDLIKINRIDELITTGMIQSEERIKKSKFNHPCSPTLAIAILTVIIWKLKFNAVNNKRENHHTVLKIFNKNNRYR